MVQWIVTDIDGCLSPEDSVPWDLDKFMRLAWLSREASEGRGSLAPLTLCTGRPQPYVELLMKLLDVRAPAICENGAVLYSLHDNTASYGPGVTQEKILGLRRVRQFIEAEILPQFSQAVLQFGKEAQLSVFSSEPQVFDIIQPRIAAFAAENGPELNITASHYYLNISLAGVDKGESLRVLLRQLGITHDQAAGIGDTEGDLPLREAVGFFACPANAKDEIKNVADYVSPYPQLEGVLDILARPEFQIDRIGQKK
jgi:HAD superfamily hydrolase (TIGR01484 family)